MILSDREIRVAVHRGLIGISPLPEDPRRWSPTTLDLTLDAELRPWERIASGETENTIDPLSPDYDSNQLVARHTIPLDCTNGWELGSGKLVLGWTIERIKLPHTSRIAGRVEGKSSLARIGLGIHVTAPTIHPGFGVNRSKPRYPGSPIRLEIWNIGPLTIKLTKGIPICQIMFEEVHGTPEEGYSGQFGVQGPQDDGGKSKRAKK